MSGPRVIQLPGSQGCWCLVPFESKLLPAVFLLLRIDFPKSTVTVTVLKFGWDNVITITVTVLASAVTPSFPLIPDYHLEIMWINFPQTTVTVTVLNCFWIRKVIISNMIVKDRCAACAAKNLRCGFSLCPGGRGARDSGSKQMSKGPSGKSFGGPY